MRKRAGDACQSPTFANSDLVIETVDLAIAGTNTTGPKGFDGFGGTLLENAALEGTEVRRNEILAV
jgi:hypothetical protein